MPVAQRVRHIPADAYQDDVDRETHSFEVEHGSRHIRAVKVYPIPAAAPVNVRQNQKRTAGDQRFELLPGGRAAHGVGQLRKQRSVEEVGSHIT